MVNDASPGTTEQRGSCADGLPRVGAAVTERGAWQTLESQLITLRAHHKSLESLAQEQASFLADLHNFVVGHAQDVEQLDQWRAEVSVQSQDNVHAVQSGSSFHQAQTIAEESAESTDGRQKSVEASQLAPLDKKEDTASRSDSATKFASRAAAFPSHLNYTVQLTDYTNSVSNTVFNRRTAAAVPSIKDGLLAWLRAYCELLLNWRFFEPVMGFVIGLNAVNIGWAIDRELQSKDTRVQEINETIFLVIFILELVLRMFVLGGRCILVPANAFDTVIVLITVITQVIKPVLLVTGGEEAVKYLEQLMVLRMMRLLRLARAVRLVKSFSSLYKLAQGLMHCFTTMVSAMVLMFITIFIFACFGAEFISKQLEHDSQVGKLVADQFSSLPLIFVTLFQFITMDSTAGIYVPLVKRSPLLAFYFLLLLVIITIALMNLITALLVEDAITMAHMDEEMQHYYQRQRLKQLTPALRVLFHELDTTGDGQINIREAVAAIREGVRIPAELHGIINPARMLDLFEALDVDQSGDLSETEFVDGLGCVAMSDVPLETMQILHLLRAMRRDIAICSQRVSLSWSTARDTWRSASHYEGRREPPRESEPRANPTMHRERTVTFSSGSGSQRSVSFFDRRDAETYSF